MKNEQLMRVLTDLGLTQNESEVYLTSLSLGPTTILSIAKGSQIRRTTVYAVVESLKKKGLIHIEPRGFKQLYAAEHPEKLETMLETKRLTLKKVLPKFAALYNLKGKESTIRYYEGLASIKTIYDTILEPLRPKDDYLVIGDVQKFFNMDKPYFEGFLQKRIKSGVKARLIVTDSEQSRYMQKYSRNMSHEVRILPKGATFSVDVMIVPQRVTIFNLENPLSAVSIENESMIHIHKQLFEIIWESLASQEQNSNI